MQDAYKINSGWGERTDFFSLKKSSLVVQNDFTGWTGRSHKYPSWWDFHCSCTATVPPSSGWGGGFWCQVPYMPIVRQPLYVRCDWNPSFLYRFLQFLWKFAVPSFFRCQAHQDTLVPDSTVVRNRTKVLHLMGIQELKRAKSGNRDMNNPHCLNRSKVGSRTVWLAGRVSERNVRAQ